MKSMYVKIGIPVLIAGLLSACGSQSTAAPTVTSQPTEQVSPATSAPTEPTQATEPTAATQPAAQGTTISFAKDVLPIIESRCINCHGGDRTEKGLSLKTYDTLMAGSENGQVIAPGNATHSKLVELIVNQKMPKRGPKLTPPQVEAITDWVNQGAPNN